MHDQNKGSQTEPVARTHISHGRKENTGKIKIYEKYDSHMPKRWEKRCTTLLNEAKLMDQKGQAAHSILALLDADAPRPSV